MFECVPFLLGCLFGRLHQRERLSGRLLLLLAMISATAATILSGEREISPWFLVPDLLIVASGVATAYGLPMLKRRLLERSARKTAKRTP